MSIDVREQYHATVIEISGKFLGSVEGPTFKALIDDLVANGRLQIVIDLSKAELMDSTAIGTLISGLTTVRRAGGDIRLANMKDRLRNLFLMTRLLGSVFENYDSLEEALQSFHEQPTPTEEP